MVLDKYVCQMAYEGDIGAVKAWLAADPSRDVTDLSFWEGETQGTPPSEVPHFARPRASKTRTDNCKARDRPSIDYFPPLQTRRQRSRVEDPRVLASDAVTRCFE